MTGFITHEHCLLCSPRQELRSTIAGLKTGTANQLGSVAETRLALGRRLRSFRNTQKSVMPFVSDDGSPIETPESAELCLPSSFRPLPDPLPPAIITLPHLCEVEAQLRFAHAKEALDSLRRYLLVQVHYSKYTRSNVRGQSGNTRSRSLLNQTSAKIQETAVRYRRIRDAYMLLKGPGKWEQELRPLLAKDVRPLKESHIIHEDGSKSLGEGDKSVSWIWCTSLSTLGSPDELHEGQYIVATWFVFILSTICQPFASNGHGPLLESSAGMKRLITYKKKCVVSLHQLVIVSRRGWHAAPPVRMCPWSSAEACEPTPIAKLTSLFSRRK